MITQYQIEYFTHNTYEAPVLEALYSFLVTPAEDDTQKVRNLEFFNSAGSDIFHNHNPFGFERACLRVPRPFTEFEFRLKATVAKTKPVYRRTELLSVEDEQQVLARPDFYIDHHLFLTHSDYTRINEPFMGQLMHPRENQPLYNYLVDLNEFIFNLIEFDTEHTHVHTKVNEVLELRKGVCQDFTHLFLGIARHNRIPCRYVSGYLNQGLNYVGSAVMHAWVEAFVPGYGWLGFDPTNNMFVDHNYIKAAHGTDYNDCSPIKGMLKTVGGHTTTYGVKVVPSLQQQLAG